ncbi:MAG: hypothetical protein KDC05_12175, partial [Bacteroidales bacterium]|nr:hypothetical protein [Bacteroidales bacterium]
FCQVPVVYTKSGEDKLIVTFTNGDQRTIPGNALDASLSADLFNRTGNIRQIDFYFKPGNSGV